MDYIFKNQIIPTREDWVDYVCKMWIAGKDGATLKTSRGNLDCDEFHLAEELLKEWKFPKEYNLKRGELAEIFRVLASDHDWLEGFHYEEFEQERLDKPGCWCVAPYLVDLAYGGPEEGGWWFEMGVPEFSAYLPLPVFYRTKREALAGRDKMQAELDAEANVGRRPKSSVLSDGVYEAHYTEGLPKSFPETRPHYE